MSLVNVNVMKRHVMAYWGGRSVLHLHTHTHSVNYNERTEGHWQLLNKLKSQRFFNKPFTQGQFLPLWSAFWNSLTCMPALCVLMPFTYISVHSDHEEAWISFHLWSNLISKEIYILFFLSNIFELFCLLKSTILSEAPSCLPVQSESVQHETPQYVSFISLDKNNDGMSLSRRLGGMKQLDD